MAQRQRYTLAEMSAKRGIKATTLRYWIENGMKYEMQGGVFFITEEDLDDFMRRRVKTETRYKLVDDNLSEDDLKDMLKDE